MVYLLIFHFSQLISIFIKNSGKLLVKAEGAYGSPAFSPEACAEISAFFLNDVTNNFLLIVSYAYIQHNLSSI